MAASKIMASGVFSNWLLSRALELLPGWVMSRYRRETCGAAGALIIMIRRSRVPPLLPQRKSWPPKLFAVLCHRPPRFRTPAVIPYDLLIPIPSSTVRHPPSIIHFRPSPPPTSFIIASSTYTEPPPRQLQHLPFPAPASSFD